MNLSKIFETVFESAPDGLMLVDDQGLIRIANLQITKLFGYEKAELIGREVEILMPDCYANSHRALRKEYAVNSRSREMGAGKSLLARRKDGSEFYAEISLSPVILNGRFFVSTAIRDVTEKKLLLEKILKHEEKIEDQNKRLLNFAHMVSHNLRSYGSNIITMVSFLERTEDKVAREEITLHLKKMADSLNDTVHHLSEVAAIQSDVSLKRQNIRVFSYVEKTMEVLSGEINRAHVAIHNLVAPGLIVSYNPAYLESIMFNFLSNGIKYRAADRNPKITVRSYSDNGHIVLSIADNGLGIDLQKYGDKLFTMHATFHGNTDARGIGLFITRYQVEAMGGKIEVESELGRGTTFRIFLS